MIEIPAACAAAGPEKLTGTPSSSTVPLSGWCTPARIFTNVDFPAPFSPSSACAVPASSRIEPSASAWTAPNALVTCRSSTTGTASCAAAGTGSTCPSPCPGSATKHHVHRLEADQVGHRLQLRRLAAGTQRPVVSDARDTPGVHPLTRVTSEIHPRGGVADRQQRAPDDLPLGGDEPE